MRCRQVPGLRNDVIIVFADAEEVGMMGAAAFNEQHPWAKDVRLAINYEGAGGTGPAILYATSNNDSWLVSEYVNAAPYPSASSLLTQIVDEFSGGRLDCDLGEYTSNGSAGLGFVVLGNTPDYHTKLDNPDVIDRGSIQQEGENTLAAVRHFGNLDLSNPSHGGDRVFLRRLARHRGELLERLDDSVRWIDHHAGWRTAVHRRASR